MRARNRPMVHTFSHPCPDVHPRADRRCLLPSTPTCYFYVNTSAEAMRQARGRGGEVHLHGDATRTWLRYTMFLPLHAHIYFQVQDVACISTLPCRRRPSCHMSHRHHQPRRSTYQRLSSPPQELVSSSHATTPVPSSSTFSSTKKVTIST